MPSGSFVLELRRRSVLRAIGIYIAAAWAFVQVVSLILPAVGAPERAVVYAWLLVVALFPLVVVVAWRYDITGDGIVRTPPASADESFDPSLKRFDMALLAVIALIAGSATWQLSSQVETEIELNFGAIDPYSVAVLPMVEIGATTDERFFALGVQASLIAALSQVQRLQVTSKVSTLQYMDSSDASLPVIGKALRVRQVVEGTITRVDDTVRIAVQLLDVREDRSVWAGTFEDKLRNINYLQSRIALELALQIKVEVTSQDRARFQSARSVNPDAYLAFLRGVFHAERYNPDDLAIAEEHFKRALTIDPDYAKGHWGLAKLCTFRGQAGVLTPDEARAQCQPHVNRALQLDPFLPEAHLGLAAIKTWQRYDFVGARKSFERAIDLNPSYAEAHMFYSHYLAIVGELEASTVHMRRALELDPLNPFVLGLYSMQLFMIDEYERAIEVAEASLDAPGVAFGHLTIWLANWFLGNEVASIEGLSGTLREIAGEPEAALMVKPMYYALGYQALMQNFAEQTSELAEQEYVPPMQIASFYAFAGDVDNSIAWLRRGFELGDPDIPYIGVNIKEPAIQAHPEFQSLLRELKLDYWADTYSARYPDGKTTSPQ
ncbi:MAG: hypothetical protein AAGH76_18365 [Pseudomonadota bacterium]